MQLHLPRVPSDGAATLYHKDTESLRKWLQGLTEGSTKPILVSWTQLMVDLVLQHAGALDSSKMYVPYLTVKPRQWHAGSLFRGQAPGFREQTQLLARYLRAVWKREGREVACVSGRPQSSAVKAWQSCLHTCVNGERLLAVDKFLLAKGPPSFTMAEVEALFEIEG